MLRLLLKPKYFNYTEVNCCARFSESVFAVPCLSLTMTKRKSSSAKPTISCQQHYFTEEETNKLRKSLLEWYDENKRDMPWRNLDASDVQKKAYGVWVSEIMLQQTQVATVINYYNKWMKTWPTVTDLSKSTLEEVNEKWSGLGYYSRGRRLREGAIKVIEELDGQIPHSADLLMGKLPGVGKYTAGAIASIAFKQATGVVDGNVLRVFSRMRGIGADITSNRVVDAMWGLANGAVDLDRPGDFNQALMELGATVCSPKNPDCGKCPVKIECYAFNKVQREKQVSGEKLTQKKDVDNIDCDIEDLVEGCGLCFADEDKWDSNLGVMNYPRKGKKKAPREEKTCVCIFQTEGPEPEYLIKQRPETGLLANLWEFPSVTVDLETGEGEYWPAMDTHMHDDFALDKGLTSERKFVDEVIHIFSHIHQTYVVLNCKITDKSDVSLENSPRAAKWVTKSEFLEGAVSTAMKKVFKSMDKSVKTPSAKSKKANSRVPDGKKQLGMAAFFKPVVTKKS